MPRPRALKCDTPDKRKAVHAIYWFGHAFLRHFLLSHTIIHAFRAIFSAKTCLQGRRPSSCAMQSQRSRFPEGECRTMYLICGPLDEGTRYLFDFECRRNIFTSQMVAAMSPAFFIDAADGCCLALAFIDCAFLFSFRLRARRRHNGALRFNNTETTHTS